MRRRGWIMLLVALVVALIAAAIWLHMRTTDGGHLAERESAAAAPVAATTAIAGAVAKAAATASVVPTAHPLTLALSGIRPARTDDGANFTAKMKQQMAAAKASRAPNRLVELKALAATGNAYAMGGVGQVLAHCLPHLARRWRRSEQRGHAMVKQLRAKLAALPATAASAAALRSKLDAITKNMSRLDAQEARCDKLTLAQPWNSFDWLERAVAAGDERASNAYVHDVVHALEKPRVVGRNPQRALRLRARARRYVADWLHHCNASRLGDYTTWMPWLYSLDLYNRYGLVYLGTLTAPVEDRNPAWVDSYGSGLSDAEKQAAQRQARAMLAACVGPQSEAPR